MQELSPADIVTRQKANPELAILDVREAMELQIVQLPNAIHIPMGEIPQRLAELDQSKEWAVLCHHGGRSLQVAMYLEQAGFNQIINIAGGIDLWAQQVDSSLARY